VIASNNGAAGEILKAGETGWLTPPGDARALAGVIQSAVRLDPETRQAVARAAQAHIAAHFDLDTMCARTLGLYADLMTV
jgi:glycosyltransferase involved in cell wall biosynthesis